MKRDKRDGTVEMAGKDATHLRLRIDSARLAKLEKAAEMNGRTLTGEIIHRLDASFAKEDLMQTIEVLADRITAKVGNVIISQGDRAIIKRDRRK